MKKVLFIVLSCILLFPGIACYARESGEVVNISILTRGTDGNAREAEVIAAMNDYSAEKIGVTITFHAVMPSPAAAGSSANN